MMKKTNIIVLSFILIEIALYIFMNMKNTIIDVQILEYLSIVLCLIFSILVTKRISFLNVGIFFTSVADLFLVILMHYSIKRATI